MSFYGVIINGIDTLENFDMLLTNNIKIGKPNLKSNYIDIPGANGSINVSYVLSDGEPLFERREISFELFYKGKEADLYEAYSNIQRLCHGKECTLTLPTDYNYYFRGTFDVGEYNGDRLISISVSAEPYKIKKTETVITAVFPEGGSLQLVLSNAMRRVRPAFAIECNVTAEFKGNTYSLAAGDNVEAPFMLSAGKNNIKLSGDEGAEMIIRYREERL